MCDPISIAVGSLLVGTGLQYKANMDRQSDMRKLQRRETMRQDKLYQEAAGKLAQNQDSWKRTDLEQKMDMASTERQAQYAKVEANAPRANEALPGQVGSNAIIGDAFTRALAGASGQAAQQGALRAELASFTDAAGANARENNRRSGDIGMIGSFSQGSANVLPYELNFAASRPRGAEMIGGILQGIGSTMLASGLPIGGDVAVKNITNAGTAAGKSLIKSAPVLGPFKSAPVLGPFM